MKLQDFDFRIWDSNTNKFMEVLISDNIRAVPINNNNIDLELWTGYKDSKGVKIYENDIVCCYFAMDGLIIFENAMFYVLNQNSGEKKTLFEALHESQAEKEPFVVESNIHFEKDK